MNNRLVCCKHWASVPKKEYSGQSALKSSLAMAIVPNNICNQSTSDAKYWFLRGEDVSVCYLRLSAEMQLRAH